MSDRTEQAASALPGTPVPVSVDGVGGLLRRTTMLLVLLTTCYYAIPDWGDGAGLGGGRLALSVLALVGFALVLRFQIRAVRTSRSIFSRAEALLTVLYLLILGFSEVYHEIALRAVAQFDGIQTRTDALYFAVTVVSTVGFGDIHATATAARALVTVQMLFDLIFIGTSVRMLNSAVDWKSGHSAPAPAPIAAPASGPSESPEDLPADL